MIRIASEEDISSLDKLINSAYRGEASKQGWTTEADLLGGTRTDEGSLHYLIKKQNSIILAYEEGAAIIGCVHLQKQGEKMYLGMLTVSPGLQAKGIGKKLLLASEEYAIAQGSKAVIMTVISVRHELIDWYERRGYKLTGKRKPFPSDDPRFGIPKQDLEFVVMEKFISP